jgi:hypothetical protein
LGGAVTIHRYVVPAPARSPTTVGVSCRPHQPSVAWWPQLFQDDLAEIAWDDEPKDYSDLPPPVAAVMAAAAAVEEQQRQREAIWQKNRQKLQVMYRWVESIKIIQ